MKKQISITLAAVILALSLTSCATGRQPDGYDIVGVVSNAAKNNDSDADSYFYPGEPDYDYKEVDYDHHTQDYYLDTVDVPWGETHHLHMVNGQIQNYFRFYALNSNDEVVNEVYDGVSTITRPRVRVFPCKKPGYVMYEVSYTQICPINTVMYGEKDHGAYKFFGVRYLDYYTGTMLPYLNVFEQNSSGGVDMEFIYEGKHYYYGFYQFKVQVEDDDEYSRDEDGNKILTKTIRATRTDYIIVPEDYDGLLLYVYVGEWTSTEPLERKKVTVPVTLLDTQPFDDEENLDDYVFFGITRSK